MGWAREKVDMIIDLISDENKKIATLNCDCQDYHGKCILNLVQVFDWYDYTIPIEATLEDDGNVFVEAKNFPARGFFLLTCIKGIDNRILSGKGENESFSIISAFVLGYDAQYSSEFLVSVYNKLLYNRENVFRKKKGKVEDGNTVFDCFAFVKNMNVSATMQYGDIEVTPFNKFRTLSESKMIDAFFQERDSDSFDYSSSLEDRFGSVIKMVNVVSDENGMYAREFFEKKVTCIVNLFSLSNYDNAETVAFVLHNKNSGNYLISIKEPHYRGNYLRLADQGNAIRKEYDYCLSTESSVIVYIQLFHEASIESSLMAAYFKYWTLLEVMAENYEIAGTPMIGWNGIPITNNAGMAVLIKDKLDSVFELIRRVFGNEKPINYIRFPHANNVKEFLSICYQRRCCYAHFGGCERSDRKRCDRTKAQYERCLSSFADIIDSYDPVLDKLAQLCRELIISEIKKNIDIQKPDVQIIGSLLMK